MYLHTQWENGSARSKMEYIEMDGDEPTPVYDRTGREMTDDEKEQFIEKSEKHNHYRKFIVSPDPDAVEMDSEEFGRELRRTMGDFSREEGRETADFAYAVHENSEGGIDDAHVLVAGEKTDLAMDSRDIERVKENATDRMERNPRYRTQEQERDRGREYEKKPRERDREHSLSEKLREQSKENLKERGDEFAKDWTRQQQADRRAAMDGSKRVHAERQANNAADMRKQSYTDRFDQDHPADQHHEKNFMDMRQQARREKLREAQRRREQRRREQERQQEQERQNDRGLGR